MCHIATIADYILQDRGPITSIKLHILCYYAQAWSLTWEERPLFADTIEARKHGPTLTSLYEDFTKRHFKVERLPISWKIGHVRNMDSEDRETVDKVLAFYGDKSTQWLVALSKLEDPCKQALERGEGSYIDHSSMHNYYVGL